MAFVKAKIDIGNPLVGTGIKCSLKRTNKSAARMTITVSEREAKQIDWQDGAKLEVLIGDGEHHGLIRLRKNNSTGEAIAERRETAKGAWFSIKLGRQAAFVDRSEAARWCQWEKVEEGWVEIVLPKWADETAPRKAQSAPITSGVARATNASPAGKQVTGALMGDPPPGRREMLAKMGDMKV